MKTLNDRNPRDYYENTFRTIDPFEMINLKSFEQRFEVCFKDHDELTLKVIFKVLLSPLIMGLILLKLYGAIILFYLVAIVDSSYYICKSVISLFSALLISRKNNASIKSLISCPPGAILLAIVDFLFSHRYVEHTFKSLVADWRYEYFEALKQGRTYKAHWISARYRYRFIMAMSLSRIFSLLKQLRSVSK